MSVLRRLRRLVGAVLFLVGSAGMTAVLAGMILAARDVWVSPAGLVGDLAPKVIITGLALTPFTIIGVGLRVG